MPGRSLVAGLVYAALLAAGANANFSPFLGRLETAHAASAGAAESRRVLRVIDGDTVVLGPNEKVRLIGVDAPESAHPRKGVECFSQDAKEFVRAAVEGQNVRLVFDQANAARRHKDRYRRTLGYLYFADGKLLNAELIRLGYAHSYTRFPFLYIVEFRELERQARRERAGLWSSCRLRD